MPPTVRSVEGKFSANTGPVWSPPTHVGAWLVVYLARVEMVEYRRPDILYYRGNRYARLSSIFYHEAAIQSMNS
jgi:hypothetical protein